MGSNEKFSTYFIEKSKSRATVRKILGLLDGVLEPTPMKQQRRVIQEYHYEPYRGCYCLLEGT